MALNTKERKKNQVSSKNLKGKTTMIIFFPGYINLLFSEFVLILYGKDILDILVPYHIKIGSVRHLEVAF